MVYVKESTDIDFVDDFENYDTPKILKGGKTYKKYKNAFIFYFCPKDKFNFQVLMSPMRLHLIKHYNYKNFINDIIDSYKNKCIIDQFKLDILRSSLFINNHKVNNIQKAINYINYSYKNNEEIFALSTQAIFGKIIEWLYLSLNNDYHIGEINSLLKINRSIIHINSNKIIVKKKLRLFKIVEGDDMTIRYLNIVCTLDDYLKSKTIDFDLYWSKIIT